MLVIRFITFSGSEDTYAHVSSIRKGRAIPVYSGTLPAWTDASKDIREARKCLICIYEGEAIMTIKRSEQKDIVKDIEANSRMFSESFPYDDDLLCFVDRQSIKSIRRFVLDAGAQVLSEHLMPDDRLSKDATFGEYFIDVCRRELSLRTGTLDEGRMLRYQLSLLRNAALPVLGVFMILALAGAVVKIKAESKKQELTSEMSAYAKMMKNDPDRRITDVVCDVVQPNRTATFIAVLASCRPAEVFLRNVVMSSGTLTVDGLTPSSDALSSFMANLAGTGMFASIGVTGVKKSDVHGMTEFSLKMELGGQR